MMPHVAVVEGEDWGVKYAPEFFRLELLLLPPPLPDDDCAFLFVSSVAVVYFTKW